MIKSLHLYKRPTWEVYTSFVERALSESRKKTVTYWMNERLATNLFLQ